MSKPAPELPPFLTQNSAETEAKAEAASSPTDPAASHLSPKPWYRQPKTWLWLGLASFLFGVAAVGAFFYASYQRVSVAAPNQSVAFAEADPTQPEEPQPFTVALLGYGGAGHDGGRLTDSIMVVSIDSVAEKIFLISVPRDLWVPLETNVGQDPTGWKINAAYAIGSDDRGYPNKPERFTGEAGGGTMAKEALELALGLEIDRFVAVDFAGFMKAVDVLGGIEVDVQKSFTDPLYPIQGRENETCGKSEEEVAATATMPAHLAEKEFPCRFEELYFPAGVIHMDAETALKYARSRHSFEDGGDFNRAARQRQVILAFKNKVLAINFIPKLIPFVGTLSGNVQTDLSAADMQVFLDRRDELLSYDLVGITLTTDQDNILEFGTAGGGQSVVVPKTGLDDWPAVHTWLQDQLAAAEVIEDITPAEATTSAKTVEVVVSRPPLEVVPIAKQDLNSLQFVVSPENLTIKDTDDWADQTISALLQDEYGTVIPNQAGVNFHWRIKDETVAEIDSQDECTAGVEEPCPNMQLRIKPQKTGQTQIEVEARFEEQPLPVPVRTIQLTIEAE